MLTRYGAASGQRISSPPPPNTDNNTQLALRFTRAATYDACAQDERVAQVAETQELRRLYWGALERCVYLEDRLLSETVGAFDGAQAKARVLREIGRTQKLLRPMEEKEEQLRVADAARRELEQQQRVAEVARTELMEQQRAAEAAQQELQQQRLAVEAARMDLQQQQRAAELAQQELQRQELQQQRLAAEAQKVAQVAQQELAEQRRAMEEAWQELQRQKGQEVVVAVLDSDDDNSDNNGDDNGGAEVAAASLPATLTSADERVKTAGSPNELLVSSPCAGDGCSIVDIRDAYLP